MANEGDDDESQQQHPPRRPLRIAFVHPDLGIGAFYFDLIFMEIIGCDDHIANYESMDNCTYRPVDYDARIARKFARS